MAGKRPLTDEEIQRILSQGFTGDQRLRNRALFALGISTGYRIAEILQHRIGDVVEKEVVKEIVKLPSRMRKRKGQSQIKRLMPFARKAMQPYIRFRFEQAEEKAQESGLRQWRKYWLQEWLFLSEEVDHHTGLTKPISDTRARQILHEAYEEAAVYGEVSSHSMRKTFAQKVYKQALADFRTGRSNIEPMRATQMHLGHSNINSTMSYLSFMTLEVDATNFEFKIEDNG